MKTKLILILVFIFSFGKAQFNISEGFETSFPAGWTQQQVSLGFTRYQSGYECEGSYSMGVTLNSGNAWALIISPSYTSNGQPISASFKYNRQNTYGTIYFYYEINNSGNWIQLATDATVGSGCKTMQGQIAANVVPAGATVKFRMQANWVNNGFNQAIHFDDFRALQETLSYTPINVTESFETGFPSNWTKEQAAGGGFERASSTYSCDGSYSMTAQLDASMMPWALIKTQSYLSNGQPISVSFQYNRFQVAGTVFLFYEINSSGNWIQLVSDINGNAGCRTVQSQITANVVPAGATVKFRLQVNHNSLGVLNIFFDNFRALQGGTLAATDVSANKKEISVYPNPVKDILNINSDNKLESAEVFSTSGQKLMTTQQNTINVSNLTSGVYNLKTIDVKGNVSTQKIIKQ